MDLTFIRRSFKDYFNEPQIQLVDNIKVGSVYSFDLIGSGWGIKYRLDEVDGTFFLDFYAHHRMTNSRHSRILQSGEIVSLENFWEFGSPDYENDEERTKRERNEIIIKNKAVEDILRQKGFL